MRPQMRSRRYEKKRSASVKVQKSPPKIRSTPALASRCRASA